MDRRGIRVFINQKLVCTQYPQCYPQVNQLKLLLNRFIHINNSHIHIPVDNISVGKINSWKKILQNCKRLHLKNLFTNKKYVARIFLNLKIGI